MSEGGIWFEKAPPTSHSSTARLCHPILRQHQPGAQVEFHSLDGYHGNGGIKCYMTGLKDDCEQMKSNSTCKQECLCIICRQELIQPKDRLFSCKFIQNLKCANRKVIIVIIQRA